MTEACPIPTPAQRQYGDIHDRIKAAMLQQIEVTIQRAADQARSEIDAAGLTMPSPAFGYLAALAHQHLFCRLCDADPETLKGGRADVAESIIKNAQNIAKSWHR